MEIQSAFNSAAQGLQRSTDNAKKAALDIADQTFANRDRVQQLQTLETESRELAAQSASGPVGLTSSLVDLKVAEVQAKASTNALRTADETVGTLIDIRV